MNVCCWSFWCAFFVRLLSDSRLPAPIFSKNVIPSFGPLFYEKWLFMHGTFSLTCTVHTHTHTHEQPTRIAANSKASPENYGLQSFFFGWNVFNGLVCIQASVINVQLSRIIKFPRIEQTDTAHHLSFAKWEKLFYRCRLINASWFAYWGFPWPSACMWVYVW